MLIAASDVFEQGNSLEESAVYLSTLSDLQPVNGDLFARPGDVYFRTCNNNAAELSLTQAWRLFPEFESWRHPKYT